MGARRIFVGTSGWTYDDWIGKFYPQEVSGAERLEYYAQQFNTVEVNATFYRNPTEAMLKAWNRRLGADFHLVVKGSRVITHYQKLTDCGEPLERFLEQVLTLKALQVILWQLPPSLHKDVERLAQFLALLPGGVRHAVEFRHRSWWDEEVAEVLRRHNAAFVAVSHPRLPPDIIPTADFLYLRFHGVGKRLYDYDYSKDELRQWVERVQLHWEGRTLYAFFNNDYHAHAPMNARRFRALLEGS